MASESGSEHAHKERPRISVDHVVNAIREIKEAKGCTLTAVKKYLACKASKEVKSNEASRQIEIALKRGLKDGLISKVAGCKYAVSAEQEDGSRKRRRRRTVDDDDGRPHRRRRSRRRRSRRRRISRRRRRRSRRRRRRSRRRGRRRSRRRRRRSRRRRR